MSYQKKCGIILISSILIASCRPPKHQAEVQGLECAGDWLTSFISAIPLPGFSLLGKVGKITTDAVGGVLKDAAKEKSATLCGSAATFSDQQMQQIKSALKDAFNEQNHAEAVALMKKIEIKMTEYVPDQDRFTAYTMAHLQSIADDSNDWITKYDQSPNKISNIEDFVIVGGFTLTAYQQIIREIALEAGRTKSAGDAVKVRQYSLNLSKKAQWFKDKMDEISQKDAIAVARTFWKSEGKNQTKKYFAGAFSSAHCYESANGNPYDARGNESGNLRKPRFISALTATNSLNELSEYARNNGTICCMDGKCNSSDDERIESTIAAYLDVTGKHLSQVMFNKKAGVMAFYSQTLPLFIDVGNKLNEADDNAIFALGQSTGAPAAPTTTTTPSVAQAQVIPTCKTAGYGSEFTCGSNQKCKKDDPSLSDSSICVLGGNTDGCDYSKAGENNGWGYNESTKQSCSPK